MIINSIKLKNFRSYEDETEFSFSPKDNKNIVLIGGENGAGKSTLFEAIKLCIYGPMSYGYLGINSNYLTKIKNNINNNAFKNDIVKCDISLSLSFKEGTQINEYTLNRSWEYIKQRVVETFEVMKNGVVLNEDEINYFNRYLQSVLPPSLFDFFFFDGEELTEFFIGTNSSNSLKDAVLQLFNYDTFNILKKQLLSFQRNISKNNNSLNDIQALYDESLNRVKSAKSQIDLINANLEAKELELDELLVKKNNLDDEFRSSGGILENERTEINGNISKLENDRLIINQEIKNFCNDILPFIIISDLLEDTKHQIEKEENISSYKSIKNKLSGEVIKKSFKSIPTLATSSTNFDEVAVTILNNMFDTDELNTIDEILLLSADQKFDILSVISSILPYKDDHKNSISNYFDKLKSISTELKICREKLNYTVSGELVENYLKELENINNLIISEQNSIVILKHKLDTYHEELKNAEYHYTRAKNQYTSSLQDNNVLELSSNVTEYLDALLATLTKDKLRLIEENFIDIFKTIIRKNEYVSSIVIDDSFESTLYVNRGYSSLEIQNIISNLGVNDISKKYGLMFIEDLLNKYPVSSLNELMEYLNDNPTWEDIEVRTKVNVNDFSKGEKQIYILCLIWALIKSSGVEVPFIIDTPYARIDESHRKTLTVDYLPNISKQVIILSTNEEIDTNLYEVIKPYICDEYLLLYNENARKTEVKKGYFEV
ncbi:MULTISPECIES: DNA sulfur modification protein DndD [unclassified Clostridium]|uniref:DNA sulfur modification protein DndD n=1 Tax=Clostridium TaxID=1485 RepID=UPI001C8C825F|nr:MULTISPECIES: DNA sulfur modification protein DndD [unclassified Clostridium]MBX9138875.1 DNA sulfur modification protein DndD [Clostridium sp. K12(2020)]MBX9145641.1 DNA sulfur modification protein DndD [Clostridium sp. K13]